MLTGPPRLAGTPRPYASMQTPMVCEWDDSESIWRTYASGVHELVERRARLRGRFGYEAQDETTAEAIIEDLETTFLVCPRTWQAGDPGSAGDEIEVECRRLSPLPVTSEISRTNPETGRPVWRIVVEFESLATDNDVVSPAEGECIYPDAPVDVTLEEIDGEMWMSWPEVTTPAGPADRYTAYVGTASGDYSREDIIERSELGAGPTLTYNLGAVEEGVTYYVVLTASYGEATT